VLEIVRAALREARADRIICTPRKVRLQSRRGRVTDIRALRGWSKPFKVAERPDKK
jgi:hypothetical protein